MKEMRELLFARVLRMTGPALQKAQERSGVVLSETGSDHLHVIAEKSAAWQSFAARKIWAQWARPNTCRARGMCAKRNQ
jgi:hypothetical protein